MPITTDTLEKITQAARAMPKADRPLTIAEALKRLAPTIQMLREKGYNWEQVREFLAGHGVETSVSSLKRFSRTGRDRKRTRARSSDGTPSGDHRGQSAGQLPGQNDIHP